MSGKGAKGLLMGKNAAANKDKEKKKPISRSSRAGLQVSSFYFPQLISLFCFGFLGEYEAGAIEFYLAGRMACRIACLCAG